MKKRIHVAVKTDFTIENDELKVVHTKTESGQVVSEKVNSYKLVEVDEATLLEHRASGNPGFVLKIGDRLFYTSIPKRLRLMSCAPLGPHCCGSSQDVCKYSRAIPEEEGGCTKFCDRSVKHYLDDGLTYEQALIRSQRIEKYSHIEVGYETFNVAQEVLVIAKCTRYKKYVREKVPHSAASQLKFELAKYVFEEAEDREAIRTLLEKNGVVARRKR